MFNCSKKSGVLVALALSTAAATAMGGIKVETVPVEKIAQADHYTVSIPESPVADVIAAFKKQTGIELTQENMQQQQGGPVMLAALNFKDLDRNDALDALGEAISMRVQLDGSYEHPNIRLMPGGAGLIWNDDVDLSVPGILAASLGTAIGMRVLGRAGGLVKSSAKRDAARKNGAKGGRPRKVDPGVRERKVD